MRKYLLLLLLFHVFQCASAQQGTIEGTLFNKVEKTGFAYKATVLLPSLMRGTISDANGHFVIPNIPVGSYELRVECIGYRDTTITRVEVAANETTLLNINFPIGCHVLNHKGKMCPYCKKSDEAIPLVYGLPTERTLQRAKKGK